MTVNAVRLNHAVLFVADLERSIAFYQQAFDMVVMAREPRANAAFLRLPRSGNHHDLGLFGVGAQPPRPARLASGSTTWPGRSTPSRSSRRRGSPWRTSTPSPASPATAPPRASTAHDPDGNEFEVMWMLPKAQLGRVRERRTGRAARPARRGRPLGRRPHRRRARPAWTRR